MGLQIKKEIIKRNSSILKAIVLSKNFNAYLVLVYRAISLITRPIDCILHYVENLFINRVLFEEPIVIFVVGSHRSGATFVSQVIGSSFPLYNLGNFNSLFPRSRYIIHKIVRKKIFKSPKNSYSNLRCHLNSRNFLYVNEGSIEVTMCVPNDIKYLYVNKNYETMEYVSEINICNVESKYMQNFNKVKFLQVIIPRNKIIQIPPYWFYHIKILEDNTLITAFKYRTIMNNISIIPDLFIKFLQDNNVKRNFTKIVS